MLPFLQVRHNITLHLRQPIIPSFMVVYIMNLAFAVYLKGCPACTLYLPMNYHLVNAIIVMGCLGIFVLKLQFKKGPYLWLRGQCLGRDYQYTRVTVLENFGEEKCWICMELLSNV